MDSDGPHGYAVWVSIIIASGTGSAEARPTRGSFILLQGTTRRPDKIDLA